MNTLKPADSLKTKRTVKRRSEPTQSPLLSPELALDNHNDANQDIGSRLRTLRIREAWTLSDAAAKLGVGRSTLAKIEAGTMSPTIGLLEKIAHGFGKDITALLSRPPAPLPAGRRVVTTAGTGRIVESDGHKHETLCDDLAAKQMLPFRSVIKPRKESGLPPWYRHGGDEFVFVLSGRVTFHSEYYSPTVLSEGDSVYFDGRMGHCLVAEDNKEAIVLFVISEREN